MNLTSKIRILMGVCPASCWTCIKFEFQFCYCERNLCVLLIPFKILSTVWIFVESVFIIPQVRPTLKPIQSLLISGYGISFPVVQKAREIYFVHISALITLYQKKDDRCTHILLSHHFFNPIPHSNMFQNLKGQGHLQVV